MCLAIVLAGIGYACFVIWDLFGDVTEPGQVQGLEPGFLFGRLTDMYDIQWRDFWDNLLILGILAVVHTSLARLVRHFFQRHSQVVSTYELVVGCGLVLYLHGSDAIRLVMIGYVVRFGYVHKGRTGTSTTTQCEAKNATQKKRKKQKKSAQIKRSQSYCRSIEREHFM